MHPNYVIPLWPEGCPHNLTNEQRAPCLEVWLPSADKARHHAAVLVCPGGGYRGRSSHEGETVAQFLASNGFVGAVLQYRVTPHLHPAPLADGCRAMRLMRQHATEWNVDSHRVAMMGFSAGGHLASTVATQPELHNDPHDDLVSRFSARPDRLVLAYPVVSMVTKCHQGSVNNLLGNDAPLEVRRQVSSELHVTDRTPPVFLFHTGDDAAVPVENSLMFAQACYDHKVPAALHVFAHGRHGVGLAQDEVLLRAWPELMLQWLRQWQV